MTEIMASRPIRIEQSRNPRTPPREVLSKSLGNYSSFLTQPRKRPHTHDVNELRGISHSGYLLKRSSRPHRSVSPFLGPEDSFLSPHGSEPMPRLRPIMSSRVELSTVGAVESPTQATVECSRSTPDFLYQLSTLSSASTQVETSVDDESKTSSLNVLEDKLSYAAAFFGLDFEPWRPEECQQEEQLPSAEASQATQRTKSIPIRLQSTPQMEEAANSPLRFSFGSQQRDLRRERMDHRTLSDCSQPMDCVGDDGHLWRAKYCVLEDGVLYFYRNQQDAESPDAQSERQNGNVSTGANSVVGKPSLPLGYSPVPTSAYASRSHDDYGSNCIWEKRVALNCVGAVRSAEFEYGKNSFELSALDNDDTGDADNDKLVLRSQTREEMNQWLFQFHCSIRTYLRDMVDHMMPPVGFGPSLSMRMHPHEDKPSSGIASSMQFSGICTPGPHTKTNSSVLPPLSHGHGRNSMHRRRARGKGDQGTSNLATSVPNTPVLASIMSRHNQSTDDSNLHIRGRLVTPSPTTYSSPTSPLPTPGFPLDTSPELSAPQTSCPELEHPIPSKKYIPPHLRNKQSSSASQQPPPRKYVPPHLRKAGGNTGGAGKKPSAGKYVPRHLRKANSPSGQSGIGMSLKERAASLSVATTDEAPPSPQPEIATRQSVPLPIPLIKRGGCADPSLIAGSILDAEFIPRKASNVGKQGGESFGFITSEKESKVLRWEVGACSECGVRNSNEDAYVIVSDVAATLKTKILEGRPSVWNDNGNHTPGLFAIFDGHCGNHAARFAAENLMDFIQQESLDSSATDDSLPQVVSDIIEKTILNLDSTFCDVCVDDGREWESGTTAIVAAVLREKLVIGNLGDARGVMSRSADSDKVVQGLQSDSWNELPNSDYLCSRRCFWKDVTDAHSPDRADEQARIEIANGWVSTETEIPISQLKRMVLNDQDVVEILKRCFADRYQPSPRAAAPQRIISISRVCGELAVSRSIGDREFKAKYNTCRDGTDTWEGSVYLPYPPDHNRAFTGDLVSNKPEFQSFCIGEEGIVDEFLLLACDGLWDVIDSDDAVRVTRDLLFEKGWSAKEAAARLAQLAIHLGSSDNITVFVIRFVNES